MKNTKSFLGLLALLSAIIALVLNARYVRGVKLLFLPSADLKRNLEGISFEVPAETSGTP
jgi:hypothetical protein